VRLGNEREVDNIAHSDRNKRSEMRRDIPKHRAKSCGAEESFPLSFMKGNESFTYGRGKETWCVVHASMKYD